MQRKTALFAARTEQNPARRIGTSEDVAAGVVFALTNTFVTGVSLGVDGGEPLV
jgi:NAD(P)-dependent dehydrogenase (short-subunit alcohol dehydrogenase family)